MPGIAGFVDFDPDKDIPSLEEKVVFITGGTAGLGQASVEALAKHSLAHIYFSGRNREAGRKLIAALGETYPKIFLTYVQVDLTDLSSIKNAVSKTFVYNRLDILLCNAGIMATPAGLSRDGYEIQFATNHLGHAMLIKQLLPVLLKTAERPGSDVRIVSVTSTGGRCIRALKASSFHNYVQPKTVCLASGFGMGKMVPVCCFPFINMANAKHIETTEQSKLANVIFAVELAKRYPQIITVSVHPRVVATGLINHLPWMDRLFVTVTNFLMGQKLMKPETGAYSQLWVAAGAKRSEIVNGGYYLPIGMFGNDKLNEVAKSHELASRLWDWTEKALDRVI